MNAIQWRHFWVFGMDRNQRVCELLHALGYIYADHGQTKRALIFQLLASRLEPDNRGVLRTLAYTFLSDGAPLRALYVIDRLRELGENDSSLDLIHSHALWRVGRSEEARQAFQQFLHRRNQEDNV
jgi:type III secretion protein Y